MAIRVLHVLSRLVVGGLEKSVVRVAQHANRQGQLHSLILFDIPYRPGITDINPGDLETIFIQRSPGFDPIFPYRLLKLFNIHRPSIVHVYNRTALFYTGLALALWHRNRLPLIATFHTRPPPGTSNLSRCATYLASFRANFVTAVSPDLANWLRRERWVRRCEFICNGVELDRYSPFGSIGPWRSIFGISASDIVVGTTARLVDTKRIDDLIVAAGLIQADRSRIHFIVAGDGPKASEIRKQADHVKRFHLTGNIVDVAAFLRCIDIFVLCSEYEDMPLSLMEAMACGKPIITTAVGGIPYLMGSTPSNPVAIQVSPRSPTILAAEIARLAESPELRCELGKRALQRIAEFSFEAEWRAYSSLYERALLLNPP